MVFRRRTARQALGYYRGICAYFDDVRAFYEVVAARLGAGEHGPPLVSVSDTRLYSSADSYHLFDPADGDRGACPSYIWFPTWFGGFYTTAASALGIGVAPDDAWNGGMHSHVNFAPDRASERASERGLHGGLIAFVWTWIGVDDAHVADVPTPECWIGLAQLTIGPVEPASAVAIKLWRFFRYEETVDTTTDTTTDTWLSGSIKANSIGCDLGGSWWLRRIALSELTSFYDVEQKVIKPLASKTATLSPAAGKNGLLRGAPTVR